MTDDFDKFLAEDRLKVDLLLVIGTSLKVSPVAEILCKFLSDPNRQTLGSLIRRPAHLPHSIPQVVIIWFALDVAPMSTLVYLSFL